MKIDDDREFERLLRGHCVRQIPSEWRQRILSPSQPTKEWPSPVAWRVLAACWLVIVALHLSARPEDSRVVGEMAEVRETEGVGESTYEIALAVIHEKRELR